MCEHIINSGCDLCSGSKLISKVLEIENNGNLAILPKILNPQMFFMLLATQKLLSFVMVCAPLLEQSAHNSLHWIFFVFT